MLSFIISLCLFVSLLVGVTVFCYLCLKHFNLLALSVFCSTFVSIFLNFCQNSCKFFIGPFCWFVSLHISPLNAILLPPCTLPPHQPIPSLPSFAPSPAPLPPSPPPPPFSCSVSTFRLPNVTFQSRRSISYVYALSLPLPLSLSLSLSLFLSLCTKAAAFLLVFS